MPLRVGDTVELVVPAPDPQPPRVEGTAVNLVEVVSAAGTPHREWEVRAVQQGHSVVRGDRPEPWAITFRVTA